MYTVTMPPIESDAYYRTPYSRSFKRIGPALRYAAELKAKRLSAGQAAQGITINGLPVETYADQANDNLSWRGKR